MKFFALEFNYESSKTLSEIWRLSDQLTVNLIYLTFGAILNTKSANQADEISETWDLYRFLTMKNTSPNICSEFMLIEMSLSHVSYS